jgi:hypothetical protein
MEKRQKSSCDAGGVTQRKSQVVRQRKFEAEKLTSNK